MKNLFLGLVLLVSLSAAAQDDSWVNRISFEATQNCPDSTNCYNTVKVEINRLALRDSSEITLTIGTSPGGNDILNRKYLFTPAVFSQQGVEQGATGNPVFNLGEYLIAGEFYVDSFIK